MVENQTNQKITENKVVSGELTAMVTVTKNTYIANLTGGQCTRIVFGKMNVK